MTTLTESKETLERRIAWAIRERDEAKAREQRSVHNADNARRRREEMHRHVGYLQDRKREVENVEAAMKGIAP
jgi:hypothetical protein